MKTIKIGKVKIKVNDKGQAKEVYEETRWDYSGDESKEIKTGVMKTRDIYYMTFQPRNEIFKATNNYFDPATCRAYSYNWWRYVDVIKGKVVFNDHNYSMTTCKHQGEMKSLLSQLGIKIYLTVDTRESLEHFQTAVLRPMYEKLFETEIAMSRKNSKPESNKARRAEIQRLKRDISKARSLGAKCSKTEIQAIKRDCLDAEMKRLSKLAEKRQTNREVERQAKQLEKTGPVFNPEMLTQF